MQRFAWPTSCLSILASLILCAATPAFADELSDFETARRAYNNGDYATAAKQLEALVGGVVPRVENPILLLESRKYLGASYLFLRREEAAREQFRLLLEQDPTYTLDVVAFPAAVHTQFNAVQAQMRKKQEAERLAQEQREQERREAELRELLRQQERLQRLEELAATESVEQINSRWIAALPFGIGQFRNGHRGLGIFFATSQTIFLAASIGTFIGHNSLRNADPSPASLTDARNAEKTLRVTNWVSNGLLLGTYIAGLTDAQVRFKPVIRTTRERQLPPELPPRPQTKHFQLQLGLTSIGARLRF